MAYNLPGCRLILTATQLTALLEGRLHNFSQLGCQEQPLELVVQRNPSGTTWNLSHGLAQLVPGWRQRHGVGQSIAWPATALQGAGNEGSAGLLLAKRGRIAYLDAAHLRPPLQAAGLVSADGRITGPDSDSGDYPLMAMGWILLHENGNGERLPALLTTLTSMLSSHGQRQAEQLGNRRLPPELLDRARSQLQDLRP